MSVFSRIAALMALVMVLAAAPVWAQQQSPLHANQMTPEQMMQRNGAENLLPKIDYAPMPEPVFEPVTFKQMNPPLHLQERIERLVQGIKVDVPPEYDHYGYEIRRYMASAAGPEILGSPVNLQGQIKNIKTAEIILKYWQEHHNKESAFIEEEIERTDASSSTRSSFKYHKGHADAFFVEAASWMRNNRAVLEYLVEIGPQAYKFEDPTFTFKDQRQLARFLALFDAQQKALEQLRGFTPFRMMVY